MAANWAEAVWVVKMIQKSVKTVIENTNSSTVSDIENPPTSPLNGDLWFVSEQEEES